MPKLYVEPDNNAPEKVSKAVGVSENNKKVYFNQDVHMKYIPNITGVQTNSVKLDVIAKNPTSLKYFSSSVLAKLRSDKVTDKRNVGHYKKGTEKHNGRYYEKGV